MGEILLLDQNTINQIAAGEVVERPASVVKELVENAIDAGATAITVEIKEGGISFLRVTDNGSGIPKEQIPLAFLRHSTSKIKSAEDLVSIHSLGFRGEALSSIAAVAQVELLTKERECFVGSRYRIEGGKQTVWEEAGCPAGTTFLVRNLFYNTPARRKFLKSAVTEAGYINELMERLALSRPDISFKYMNAGKLVLHTTGSGELKDILYHIYGRQTVAELVPITYPENEQGISLSGYVGKPVLARGNRAQENYMINGRYIRCAAIGKAIEDAYRGYVMGHKYPFTAFHIRIPSALIDVNVHPSKMELRFSDSEAMYRIVYQAVGEALSGKNMIVPVTLLEKEDRKEQKEQQMQLSRQSVPEPFEQKRAELLREEAAPYIAPTPPQPLPDLFVRQEPTPKAMPEQQEPESKTKPEQQEPKPQQLSLPEELLARDGKKEFQLIGQLFATYWMIELDDQLLLIDQHAAHEKVLYERTMKKLRTQEQVVTQSLYPPLILSLSLREAECLEKNRILLSQLGFAIEEFGGQEYKLTEVPAELVTVDGRELLEEILQMLLAEREYRNPELLLEKVASLSCKAAVKGNHRMSETEAKALIQDMLSLENPYHCPHGRPTTIAMSKYEIERKFKRIV